MSQGQDPVERVYRRYAKAAQVTEPENLHISTNHAGHTVCHTRQKIKMCEHTDAPFH